MEGTYFDMRKVIILALAGGKLQNVCEDNRPKVGVWTKNK